MRIAPNAWIEPVLQELRIWKIRPHLPKGGDLVDLGCDVPQILIDKVCNEMRTCTGVDVVVEPAKSGNITLLRQDLQKKVDLPSRSADAVTMLAVLEHMKHPKEMMQEAYRILRPGGVLLVTVPSPASKPFLDVFAKIGLVRQEMIDQHENYFTLEQLRTLARGAGFSDVFAEHWELGVNSFLKATK